MVLLTCLFSACIVVAIYVQAMTINSKLHSLEASSSRIIFREARQTLTTRYETGTGQVFEITTRMLVGEEWTDLMQVHGAALKAARKEYPPKNE